MSLLTALVFGVNVLLRLPPDPTTRMVGAMSVVMWYVLSRQIVLRVARAWFLR
ncbi:MAG: hypothetical protein IH965_07375 [Gemmatimonadetes bacterium]|nr:hypothetical protein [Gemmatimonadota bacterium]